MNLYHSIETKSGDLRPALTALAKVVKTNAKNSPAELACIKVETPNRSALRLTGTDLDTFFSVDLPADVSGYTAPYLVPLKQLQDETKADKTSGVVRLEPSHLSVDNFPETPAIDTTAMPLEPKIAQAILRAFGCVSTDPTRQVINGALVDPSSRSGHHIVGTDGRHLFSSNSFVLAGLKRPIILPGMKLWSSPLVRGDSAWSLALGKEGSPEHCLFRIDGQGWSVTGKLNDGTFPNYSQVVDQTARPKAKVILPERSQPSLVQLLGRLPGAKLQNSPVGLRIGTHGLSILARESEDADYGEHLVPEAETSGDCVTVFLSRDYFGKALEYGLNRIEVTDAVSPVKLHRDGSLMIVMPVREAGEVRVKGQSPIKVSEVAVTKPEASPEVPPVPVSVPSPRHEPIREQAPEDPVEVAIACVAQIREALKAAESGLGSLLGSLRAVRQERKRAEKEIQAVRGTLRSLRNLEL